MLFKIVSTEKVKTTYAWTREVAELVAADYLKRFGKAEIEERQRLADFPVHDYGFDFGGIGMMGMPVMAVETPSGFIAGFFADQAVELEAYLKEELKDRGGYMKIHGKYSCVCLPTQTVSELREQMSLRVDEAVKVSNQAWEDWQEKFGKK